MGVPMKIAVVGATGNIGLRVCRRLLAAGHHVRALSRGGRLLDELVRLGAEPWVCSFDGGTGDLGGAFQGMDAAFTMVRSDWTNLFHYRQVAARLADALQASPVSLIVNLSAYGAEIGEGVGHFSDFWRLEQTLNQVAGRRKVHLRAGWFMENYHGHFDSIARYGMIATELRSDLKVSHVATCDIADAAAHEFIHPVADALTVRELRGSADLSQAEAASLISGVLGRRIEAARIDPDQAGLKEEFVRRFGTAEQWEHRLVTYNAMNEGRICFHEPRTPDNSQPTRLQDFLRMIWRPPYDDAVTTLASRPESFTTWVCTVMPAARAR
jgi:uncharacterized protein YbjT (DUF2867 family)